MNDSTARVIFVIGRATNHQQLFSAVNLDRRATLYDSQPLSWPAWILKDSKQAVIAALPRDDVVSSRYLVNPAEPDEDQARQRIIRSAQNICDIEIRGLAAETFPFFCAGDAELWPEIINVHVRLAFAQLADLPDVSVDILATDAAFHAINVIRSKYASISHRDPKLAFIERLRVAGRTPAFPGLHLPVEVGKNDGTPGVLVLGEEVRSSVHSAKLHLLHSPVALGVGSILKRLVFFQQGSKEHLAEADVAFVESISG